MSAAGEKYFLENGEGKKPPGHAKHTIGKSELRCTRNDCPEGVGNAPARSYRGGKVGLEAVGIFVYVMMNNNKN